jgi:hypothetical protein
VINDPARDSVSLEDHLTKIYMICHDQEPLFYDYYSFDTCLTKSIEVARKKNGHPDVGLAWYHSERFLNTMAKSHLRVAVGCLFNLHDTFLICHSEKNSEQLKIYEQNGFIGVYYWAHALIARNWFRFAEHDPRLVVDFDSIDHDFLIYSRAWSGTREYRLKFNELIVDNNLLPNCNIKFNPWANDQHYTNHQFANNSLSISRSNFEDIMPLNSVSSSASADYVNSDYSTSGIEIVLETLFDDNRNHLTEKILKPIACGRPFMLAGTPGSLEYLQSYGFKTFNELIDETYDTIADPAERLTCIVNEMKRISNLSSYDKKILWTELYKISEYNKFRFFSSEFHNDVVNEYVNNVNIGIQKCNQTMTGKWWNLAHDPDIIGGEPSTTENTINIEAWLEKNFTKDQQEVLSMVPSQPESGTCFEAWLEKNFTKDQQEVLSMVPSQSESGSCSE